MYSMNLDSVREKNKNNQIMAEVSLMRAALMGNPAVLSPNQAMDSLALQEIILNNKSVGSCSNPFCDAVALGLIRVAIPEDARDLVDCCMNTLSRGLNDPSAEFIISGLGFLYVKDDNGNDVHPYKQRCEVTHCILTRLTQGRKNYSTVKFPDWLKPDEKEMIEQYIESIVLLDKAVITYENFVSVKRLFPRILERLIVERLTAEETGTEISELLLDMQKECTKVDAPIIRSYYYRYLEDRHTVNSTEALAEVRTIIDLAYNRVMAMSVSSGAEMSIPNDFRRLSDSIIRAETPECAFQSSYTDVEDVSCLNWEMMVWIYKETQAIMEHKGLDWWRAINELYARESKLPFVLGSKYICYTSLKVAVSAVIPGGTIINFIQELIDDTVGDLAGERLPGSIGEVRSRARQARDAKNILDTIIFKEHSED